MKKKTKIILVVLAVLVIGFFITGKIIFASIDKSLEGLKNLPIENVDMSSIGDGTYKGKYEAFPIMVELNVTVVNHKITDIKIIKHENGKGAGAEAILDEVIENQTLKVDAIAGATHSSKVILKAIENALSRAND